MFDANAFLNNAYYAPLSVGTYTVTIKGTEVIIGDKCRVVFQLEFQSGRIVSAAVFDKGIKIACDGIRAQLEDYEDYPTARAFIESLSGKTVDVTLERVTYAAKDGTIKSTINYSFRKPETEDAEQLNIEL